MDKRHQNSYTRNRYNNSSSNAYYNNSNLAYELEPQWQQREQEEEQQEILRREKMHKEMEARKAGIRCFKLMLALGFICSGCIVTMIALSTVSEQQMNIRNLKDTLAAVQNQNIILAAEISDNINLEYVEERSAQLGMSEPQPYQVKYIDVPKQSYTVQYKAEEEKSNDLDISIIKEFFAKK